MQRKIVLIILASAACGAAHAGPNVGVSIGINQPGMYGRIDIGNMAPPPVIYAQPVIVAPSPVAVYQQPIYLYVPPAHQAQWSHYCGAYGACGQPVYFVREGWVRDHRRRGDDDRDDSDRRERRREHSGKHDHHDD